ncbi:Uncharacterized protein DAT39_021631, partial [Clarias magur]
NHEERWVLETMVKTVRKKDNGEEGGEESETECDEDHNGEDLPWTRKTTVVEIVDKTVIKS